MTNTLRALASKFHHIWAMTVLHWIPVKWQRYIFNRYSVFSLFMLCYTTALQLIGGLPSLGYHFFYEAPFLLGLYFLFSTLLKPSAWTPYIAALPLVLAYTADDAFFVAYGAVFKIIDLHDVPELIDILPLSYKLSFSALIGLPLLLYLRNLDWRKFKPALAGGLSLFMIGSTTEFVPQPVTAAFENIGAGIIPWSDASSVRNKGRLGVLLYFEAKRKQMQADTAAHRNRELYVSEMTESAKALSQLSNKHNVHLIVLESFLDPTLLKGVRFSKDPRHPDYIAHLAEGLGFSIAPVFGGSTSQSEFEALCGVPALRKISNIEFNAFGGEAAFCLPGILAQGGYQTIATNGFKPNFFNTIKAYNGIGFGEAYFASEYAKQRPTYFSTGPIAAGETYMFDGTLFDENLRFIKKRMQEKPGQPILNYVLSIYGHFPHYMDPEKRPQVLTMQSEFSDEQLLRAANQHYYRTEAIFRYVKGLIEADPNSMIIFISDHLPPLIEGTQSYRKFGYLENAEGSTFMNRILVIENGKNVKYPTIHHYDVPSLIYNYLTDGKYCAAQTCNLFKTVRSKEEYEQAYLRLMAHVVEGK
jgi:phosphoglycerol transferase MdoB-like AlkP superfamily enzyme